MMEQWEIDLRAKLEKELPEGGYELSDGSVGGMVLWTGKQGKINHEVEFIRACKKYYPPPFPDNKNPYEKLYSNVPFDLEVFRKELYKFFNPEDKNES